MWDHWVRGTALEAVDPFLDCESLETEREVVKCIHLGLRAGEPGGPPDHARRPRHAARPIVKQLCGVVEVSKLMGERSWDSKGANDLQTP